MTSAPPPPPSAAAAEWIGRYVRSLLFALQGPITLGRLPRPLANPLMALLSLISQRFNLLAARLAAGLPPPRRRAGPRRARPTRPPPPPGPFPRWRGWLRPLLIDWESPIFAACLDTMLRDPAVVSLIEAAPTTLVRQLRSVCWMLDLKPPPHLARPRPARPKPAAPAPKAPRPRTRPRRPSVPPPPGMAATPPPARAGRAKNPA